MTRATLARLIGAMLLLGAAMSAFLLQFDWFGDAASEEAPKFDTLMDVMIVLSSFVFAIVMVMLGYSIWRYRAKPGDESDGEPIHGNTKLEVAWTAIPTVIVLFGAIYSWVILDDIEARENPMPIGVTAQQFKWTFEYPEEGVSANELHVPAGQQIELTLNSVDVIHSFWVPEWRVKKDVVPGLTTSLVTTPDREGTYSAICTELCGIGHSTMRAFVVVEPRDEFERWVARQPQIQEGGVAQAAREAATQTE